MTHNNSSLSFTISMKNSMNNNTNNNLSLFTKVIPCIHFTVWYYVYTYLVMIYKLNEVSSLMAVCKYQMTRSVSHTRGLSTLTQGHTANIFFEFRSWAMGWLTASLRVFVLCIQFQLRYVAKVKVLLKETTQQKKKKKNLVHTLIDINIIIAFNMYAFHVM
jgi:hypothetical protein